MNIRSRLIVLHTIRYQDDTLIADCFSESEGRVALMVRISHSSRAAVKYTLFQPLAVLEVEWKAGARQDSIAHPRFAAVAVPLRTLHFDPVKSSLSFFVADFLYNALRSEQVEKDAFAYIVAAIEWLDVAETGLANFHLVFLLRLTRFFGIVPKGEHYADGACFDLREGDFLRAQPFHDDWLPAEESRVLHDLMALDFTTMGGYTLTRAMRNTMLRDVLRYYRIHLSGFPALKSLEVLSVLFD